MFTLGGAVGAGLATGACGRFCCPRASVKKLKLSNAIGSGSKRSVMMSKCQQTHQVDKSSVVGLQEWQL